MKREFTDPEVAERFLASLLRDRLSNYGYDRKNWRRIQAQRARAKQAIRPYRGLPMHLKWQSAPLSSRIDFATGTYTVGQSQNEEITNLLRQLVNPEAPWVS